MSENISDNTFKWFTVITTLVALFVSWKWYNVEKLSAGQLAPTTGGVLARNPRRRGMQVLSTGGSLHTVEPHCGNLNGCAECSFGPQIYVSANTEAAYYSCGCQPRHRSPISKPDGRVI